MHFSSSGNLFKFIFKVLTRSFMAGRLAFLRGTLSTPRQVDKNIKRTEKYRKQMKRKESYMWYGGDVCSLSLCLYLSYSSAAYKYPNFPAE